MRKLISKLFSNFYVIIIDVVLINSIFFTYRIFGLENFFFKNPLHILLISFLFVIFGYYLGLYNIYNRYFSIKDFKLLSAILGFCCLPIFLFENNFSFENIFITYTSSFVILLSYRIIIKQSFTNSFERNRKRISIIFGASERGVFLKRALFHSSIYKVIGFVDTNKELYGKLIDGVKVYNFDNELFSFIDKKNIKHVIFSESNLSNTYSQYINYFKQKSIKIYTLPPKNLFSEKTSTLPNIKDLRIEDILTRPEINIDFNKNKVFYQGKTILVTGGAGSIGSEIVRQLNIFNPKKIIVIDINETALFYLNQELQSSNNIDYHLINILNDQLVEKLFKKYNFDCIFHAAAYKHVPVIEDNPFQGIKNNVLGTYILSNLSIKHNVEQFILVSTDKAVNPTNVMGASKRICELILGWMSHNSRNTKFITTRFGNVLGSSGSVIPIFKKQIEDGGPVTLTHKEITRYFMTIPEASKLVLEACRIGDDNQIFVFDMGSPVKILDLAKNMISLSGSKPEIDIKIKIIGLRPGEKLFEELLLNTEEMVPSDNKHIFIAKKEEINNSKIKLLDKLISIIRGSELIDSFDLLKLVKKIIPEFKSKNSKFESLD